MTAPTQEELEAAAQTIEAANTAAANEMVGVFDPVIEEMEAAVAKFDDIATRYGVLGSGESFVATKARQYADQLRSFLNTANFLNDDFKAATTPPPEPVIEEEPVP